MEIDYKEVEKLRNNLKLLTGTWYVPSTQSKNFSKGSAKYELSVCEQRQKNVSWNALYYVQKHIAAIQKLQMERNLQIQGELLVKEGENEAHFFWSKIK